MTDTPHDKFDFIQQIPPLPNQFTTDPLLSRILERMIPADSRSQLSSKWQEVGADTAQGLTELADQAERHPPQLRKFSSWGKQIDEIEMHESWKKLETYAVQQGIVAIAYERKQGALSRVHQAALIYLFHPSSAFVTCPLAMTDGAARALELYGSAELKHKYMSHLISRDPKEFWTSGQWMTEKTGGSDVGLTRTQAQPFGDLWKLYGYKWFTSATTSQMAMTLARPEGAEDGVKGLSLYVLQTRTASGDLNHLEILRLKDKLGTKALPTAELKLQGTMAEAVGGMGNGVRKISSLFNISRIYNAICATADLRRGLAMAEQFAANRVVFKQKLQDQPIHRKVIEGLNADFAKCLHFTMAVALLLGKDECGEATPEEKGLLRILTPLLKLYTGKKVVSVVSEVVEIFGGQGYVEDSGIARLCRNAQVFPIWEGTTNVLSLDLLRAFEKEAPFEVLQRYFDSLKPSSHLKDSFLALKTKMGGYHEQALVENARFLAWNLADLMACALVENFAAQTQHPWDVKVARSVTSRF